MVKTIKKGKTYIAEKNIGGLKKGKKYKLLGQNNIPDPRGFAYYFIELIFRDIKTRNKVSVIDLGPEDLSDFK